MENERTRLLFPGLLLVMLVLITYGGAGKNNLVDWDDNDYVVNNPLVRDHDKTSLEDIFTTVISLNYHPLTILTMRLNNNKCDNCPNGISAAPFIRGNIILHLLNTLLVFILIFLLSKKKILLSFLVAAIFGVHPMHVESVAWVSERKDVLYTFFFLAGLIAYIFYRNASRSKYLWLAISFMLFIFSCLSKAMAVVFPVVIILTEILLSGEEEKDQVLKTIKNIFQPRLIVTLIPFFLVSLFFGMLAVKIQGGESFLWTFKFYKNPHDVINVVGPFSFLQRLQVASYGFIFYIIRFFFPVNLSPVYPYPPMKEFTSGTFPVILWLTLITVIILLIFSILSLRKTKIFFFGLGFYFVTIALVLQFMSVGTAMVAERYSYLPYIGLAFIPASLIDRSPEKLKKILTVISGLFILILMFLAIRQVKVWNSSDTLWTKAIERHPALELARSARGKYYYMLSSHARSAAEKVNLENKAYEDFRQAILLGTKTADVYEGMGMILESRDDPEKALVFLDKAISIDSKKGRSYYNRAVVRDRLNMKDEAINDYSTALALSPDLAVQVLGNRSVLLLETGRFREAVSDLDRLISTDSGNHMYFYNRAFAKLQLKDINGAIEDYKTVIRLNPSDETTKRQLQILIDSRKN